MTPAEIRHLVRVTVGVPDSFEDLDNDVIDQLWGEGASLMTNSAVPSRLASSVSIPISAGVDSYSITGNPERLVSLNLDGVLLKPYNLEKLEREDPSWATASGNPDRYWVEGVDSDGNFKVRLYPNPSAPGTMTAAVISKPRPLSSFASLEVSQFSSLAQYALVYFVAWRWAITSRAMVAADKLALWKQVWDSYMTLLASSEDPTSVMAQKATAERSFRLVQQ